MLREQTLSLRKLGHDVRIISRRINKNNEKIPSSELPEHGYMANPSCPPVFVLSSIINSMRKFDQLAEDGFKPDVAVIHQSLSGMGPILFRKHQIPIWIYECHSLAHEEYMSRNKPGNNPFSRVNHSLHSISRRLVEHAVIKRSDKIIVLSQFSKERLISAHKIAENMINIIPGGADTSRFTPAENQETVRAKLNLPKDKIILFTVRNLVPRMGIENLIHAIAGLNEAKENIRLIIGGTGVLRSSLENLTLSLGLKNIVSFQGFIPEDDLTSYYQAADLFVLPTLMLEGFGLVTVEAMACGTPVLGTPSGATPEILDKVDTRLITNGSDSASMAEAIKKLIKLMKDSPAEWTSIVKKCRDTVNAEYNWDINAKRMEAILGIYHG